MKIPGHPLLLYEFMQLRAGYWLKFGSSSSATP
jgi:hypothetical protein